MSASAVQMPARAGHGPRRLWIAALIVLVAVAAYFAPRPYIALRGQDDEDPVLGALIFASGVVPVLCYPLLILWCLLLSGMRWVWRFVACVLLLAVGAGFAASVRRVNMGMAHTNALRPHLTFFWEADPDEVREKHRAAAGPVPGPEGINFSSLPSDFPGYRGPKGDGVIASPPKLETDWDAHPPRERWKQPCSSAYSGFAVAGNVVVTAEQRRRQESVVCYDRDTGKERWAVGYPCEYRSPMGDGPRGTPLIDDGLVYNLGANGDLVCIEGKTGQKKWHKNLLTDSKAKNIQWGLSSSPVRYKDWILVQAGIDPANNAGEAFAAYDRLTGERAWAAGKVGAGYASPQVRTIGGVEQLVLFDADGLAGYDLSTRTELWRHPWKTDWDMNDIQPAWVADDLVCVSSEQKNGTALLRIEHNKDDKAWKVTQVWKVDNLAFKFSNPVTDGKFIYAIAGGKVTCIEAASGKVLWRGGRYGQGQVLLAGDVLVVLADVGGQTPRGEVALVAAGPEGYRELAGKQVLEGKTWNTHALAGNQLFIRSETEMACLELSVKGP